MVTKIGDNNEQVKLIQQRLIQHGYQLKADGDFGPKTEDAVKDFQKKNGLVADGIVGTTTLAALQQGVAGDPGAVGTVGPVGNTGILIPKMIDFLLTPDEYYNEVVPKTTIYLHHTAGGSRPDYSIQGWERDSSSNGGVLKVGTAFVVGRASSSTADASFDGKIYRAFDEKYWCHHLGCKTQNNTELNKRSVGIEICNYGPLTKTKDGKFINYVNKEILPEHVVELKNSFKGFKYYERYTDAQLAATKTLLLYLGNKFNIDVRRNITESWFSLNNDALAGKPGLWSHIHVRADKFDCFPQPELIDMINSL